MTQHPEKETMTEINTKQMWSVRDTSPEKEPCRCKEMTCKVGCKNKHTHKTFFCDKCEPETSAKMYSSPSLESKGMEWEERFEKEFITDSFQYGVWDRLRKFIRHLLTSTREEATALARREERERMRKTIEGLLLNPEETAPYKKIWNRNKTLKFLLERIALTDLSDKIK